LHQKGRLQDQGQDSNWADSQNTPSQGIKLYALVDAFYMSKSVVKEAKKREMESIGRLKSK
jgi:hypothetical protein